VKQDAVQKVMPRYHVYLSLDHTLTIDPVTPWDAEEESFTSAGSLVSHFKALYGPDYFVKLNCAYYLPGLPVSVLQQHLDEHADARFGSHR
jgi:hypothetical protein